MRKVILKKKSVTIKKYLLEILFFKEYSQIEISGNRIGIVFINEKEGLNFNIPSKYGLLKR